jgi:hypothetical protein
MFRRDVEMSCGDTYQRGNFSVPGHHEVIWVNDDHGRFVPASPCADILTSEGSVDTDLESKLK